MVKLWPATTNFESGQMRSNLIDRSNFSRACGAHLNTRLFFCIVHGILDRFCDDQRPEPQLTRTHAPGAPRARARRTHAQRYFHSLFPLGSGLRGHLVRGRGGIVCRSERRRSEFKMVKLVKLVKIWLPFSAAQMWSNFHLE